MSITREGGPHSGPHDEGVSQERHEIALVGTRSSARGARPGCAF